MRNFDKTCTLQVNFIGDETEGNIPFLKCTLRIHVMDMYIQIQSCTHCIVICYYYMVSCIRQISIQYSYVIKHTALHGQCS